MKLEISLAGYCGRYCGRCSCRREGTCTGCRSDMGSRWGRCTVYTCCVERGLEHCGLCPDIVCDRLSSVNSVFGNSKGALTRSLKERARKGTATWMRSQRRRPRSFHWTEQMQVVWT